MSEQQIRLGTLAENPQQGHKYEYKSLPVGGFARYLVLQPASSDTDPLVCNLYTARLEEFPPFEAISYVWGSSAKNRPITCDGNAFYITENLLEALHQVRLVNKPRTLWVDLICINQTDAEERGHQVSMMGQIYKTSICTLICMGISDRVHAPIVADLVSKVDSMTQDVFGRADFSWRPRSFPFPSDSDPLLSHGGWESFNVLLQKPWFGRGWVVQEAALGTQTLVLWANTAIDWLKIVQTYIWGIHRALMLPNIQKTVAVRSPFRGAVTFRLEGAIQPLKFLERLDCARWLDFTDPRDRIYALLGLPSGNEWVPTLKPSYMVPDMHIYRDFACEYLRISQDLDILHFLHNDDSTLASEFASWIPRWNIRLYSSYSGTLNNYSRFSRCIVSQVSSPKIMVSSDQTTLEVRAILLDTVAFTSAKFDQSSTTSEDVASLWETVSTLPNPLPYLSSPLKAFVTIFRCGVYRGVFTEWETRQSAYMRLLSRNLSREDVSYGDAEAFHTSKMEDVHNKRFLVTNRGYYGLAPGVVQEGDICCVIFGTKSPFILRKTDKVGHYKVVGSALILSKEIDHNGYPMALGSEENCEDWVEWGLDEEDIFLC
ncbi:heterokaryon incompatibility protein-domain-containing protein [Mariannaea sp. PMI_226]|nr:heterokaryon incompatibility protein-domain-containing protein [Mariannaea sp. PMI_226]